jgi:hypothetical protein
MNTTSLLPEDYLAQKADRRTNVICLTLFAVVMTGVFSAFLITNKQWTKVKAAQESISSKYEQAGVEIETLNELEQQKKDVLHKAELAAALVERVPRSILLAELINRMPDQLSLLNFSLSSDTIRTARPTSKRNKDGTARLTDAKRARTKEDAGETINKVEAPKYRIKLVMTGVAPTDRQVAQYIADLNGFELLHNVALVYSEETKIEGRKMREFQLQMELDSTADVRDVTPMTTTVRNPMTDDMHITAPVLPTEVFAGDGALGQGGD